LPREYVKNPLWNILVETAKSLPLYHMHKAYVLNKILGEDPFITYEELSTRMGIPRGEALVILHEIRMTREDVDWELKNRTNSSPRFSKAATGGTFNEVHYGHIALLLTAFKESQSVIIGITSDDFVSKMKKAHEVKPYEERVSALTEFLKNMDWLERATLVKLDNPYGPPVEEADIEALVASPFTAGRGEEINRIRVEKGMKPLEIITCPIVFADDGKPISSTRIALGEISPDGKVLKKL